MNKWTIAVAAMLAVTATGAFAQRGMGRGPASAGTRVPTAPKVQTKQPKPVKVAGVQHQAKAMQFNEAQTARLQPMLPAGMAVDVAAEGFKNRGQFMAALQVSKNLGIPFEDLKTRMTGEERVSLGRAIQELRPAMTPDDATQAAKTAERQARDQEREMRRQEKQVREPETPAPAPEPAPAPAPAPAPTQSQQ
jgi:Sec-independent protein translocase protein TatA